MNPFSYHSHRHVGEWTNKNFDFELCICIISEQIYVLLELLFEILVAFVLQRSRVSEAEEWYSKAFKTAPNNPVVRVRFADFLSTVGRLDDAVEQYKAAAALASDDHEIVVKTATALRKAGWMSDSETYYKKAVRLYPQVSTEHWATTRIGP